MKAQSSVVLFIIIGACILAFSLPVLIAGGRLERHDDIILFSRYTATATPLDRELTREAYALLFFSPTSSSGGASSSGVILGFPFTLTYTPVTGLTTIPIPPTLWNATFTSTVNSSGNFGPSPTPTWTLTLTPSPTYTFTPTGTITPPTSTQTRLPTFTPLPTNTPKLTNTAKPTSTIKPTSKPTNTPKPTNTRKPTNTPKPHSNSTPTPSGSYEN